MNNNKRLKPNLVDPIMSKRIIKTLAPEKPDYWAPTKNGLRSFYNNFIKKNIAFVIIVILFILFLIHRYRSIKKDRDDKIIENIDADVMCPPVPVVNTNTSINSSGKKKDASTDEYTKLLLQYYNYEKESAREPVIKKFSNRMNPAPGPKLAYPMYPYTKGGTLLPGGSR